MSYIFNKPTSKIIQNKKFISRGLIGVKGDIVVDNINNPKIIYGICNGNGGFEKNKDLSKFYTIINENNSNNRL